MDQRTDLAAGMQRRRMRGWLTGNALIAVVAALALTGCASHAASSTPVAATRVATAAPSVAASPAPAASPVLAPSPVPTTVVMPGIATAPTPANPPPGAGACPPPPAPGAGPAPAPGATAPAGVSCPPPAAPGTDPQAALAAPAPATAWTYAGRALLQDNFASDPDVVKLDDGTYRMYYGQSPLKPNSGPEHPILSARSTDGHTFTPEAGVRLPSGAFPDVVHLPDGRWRMYFQGGGGIRSAISTDGLNWTEEPGVRVDTSDNAGLPLSQVSSPTTMARADGTFVMVYAGTINQPYGTQKLPNQDTHLFLWATSSDGLHFTPQGIAIDSRNDTYQGWLDGPDWSHWADGWHLFYWGYRGVYSATFDGHSFGRGQFAFAGQFATNQQPLPEDPAGDPSLIRVGGTWAAFYDTGVPNSPDDLIYEATLPAR